MNTAYILATWQCKRTTAGCLTRVWDTKCYENKDQTVSWNIHKRHLNFCLRGSDCLFVEWRNKMRERAKRQMSNGAFVGSHPLCFGPFVKREHARRLFGLLHVQFHQKQHNRSSAAHGQVHDLLSSRQCGKSAAILQKKQ